ncbi:hypothetical protein IHE45_18G120200 [Dioscorea alata]|uniref:Uncharacterized protein n=1 Tax=Dioscorea alata TaxID=55571 RepID=A0ACB7U9W1_DIOAL|nr:hypothetical protein IHE45_18G120200 [Dioscorea alata]
MEIGAAMMSTSSSQHQPLEEILPPNSGCLCYGLKENLFNHGLNIFGTQGSDKSTSGGLCLPNKRLSFKPLRENLLWFFQSNPKAAFSPVFSKAVHIPPRTNHLRSTAINDWDGPLFPPPLIVVASKAE